MTKANCTTQEIKRQRKKNTLGYAYSSERYIELATKAHKGEYTYEKVRYVNAKTKIIVTCKTHGDFDISPSYHLNLGGRCGKCFPRVGNRKPATNEQFIAKARKKHGSRFDYSKTEYKHSQEPIVIICKDHGEFTQSPDRHLRTKYGCPQCGKLSGIETNTKSTARFIADAKKVHLSKYNYSKTKYKGSAELVIITCKEHGDFERTASTHLLGYGCNECAGVKERMKSTADFIERATAIHGNKYDYKETKYKDWNTKVEIRCKEHGIFKQSVAQHMKGSGCQQCGRDIGGGWSRSDFKRISKKNNDGNASLYVIKCLDGDTYFYKLGITTTDLKIRFRNTRSMPYGYTTEYSIDGEAGYIYDLEVRLHSLLKSNAFNPSIKFRGYTECFSSIKPIERLLKTFASDSQIQLIA